MREFGHSALFCVVDTIYNLICERFFFYLDCSGCCIFICIVCGCVYLSPSLDHDWDSSLFVVDGVLAVVVDVVVFAGIQWLSIYIFDCAQLVRFLCWVNFIGLMFWYVFLSSHWYGYKARIQYIVSVCEYRGHNKPTQSHWWQQCCIIYSFSRRMRAALAISLFFILYLIEKCGIVQMRRRRKRRRQSSSSSSSWFRLDNIMRFETNVFRTHTGNVTLSHCVDDDHYKYDGNFDTELYVYRNRNCKNTVPKLRYIGPCEVRTNKNGQNLAQ